jgi:hypothetical protein
MPELEKRYRAEVRRAKEDLEMEIGSLEIADGTLAGGSGADR